MYLNIYIIKFIKLFIMDEINNLINQKDEDIKDITIKIEN